MMVLSELLQPLSDGWQVTKGIKWKTTVERKNKVIKIVCPRCGRVGNLIRANHRNRVGFRVIHEEGACHFGWTQEEYDVLREIYMLARLRRRL